MQKSPESNVGEPFARRCDEASCTLRLVSTCTRSPDVAAQFINFEATTYTRLALYSLPATRCCSFICRLR